MGGPKGVAVLGSTGSIGVQTLEVLAAHPERFRVVALSAHSNRELLARQLVETKAGWACLTDVKAAAGLKDAGPASVRVLGGPDGLVELASLPEAEIILNAVVGSAGLRASLAALQSGKRLALANKESLIAGGDLVRKTLATSGELLPVDSEHSAIFQCLAAGCSAEVRRIILTVSGGPFRGMSGEQLAAVTREEALAHPTWKMGPKITVDSATLMNKGLEVIEAHYLFDVDYDAIEVVVHPQSIVHSLVEFVDGSIIAQMGSPDMRLPIAYALNYPERLPASWVSTDLVALGSLTFEPVDRESFRCLGLAYDAGRRGGSAPAVLNAANEVAVAAFLSGRIGFVDIARVVEAALAGHTWREVDSIDSVEEVELEARKAAEQALGNLAAGER